VKITAPPEILAASIACRHRESASDQLARLRSKVAETRKPDLTIVNDGDAKTRASMLIDYLCGLLTATAA